LELQNGWEEEGMLASSALAQDDRTLFQRTLRLPVPLLDSRTFLKLLQLDLRAHPPGAPIVKIHLAAEPVRPRAAQNGLFLPPSPEPEKLELTLARIAGIVGEDKVGSLELLDTHRPEGFRMRHFAHEREDSSEQPKNPRKNDSLVIPSEARGPQFRQTSEKQIPRHTVAAQARLHAARNDKEDIFSQSRKLSSSQPCAAQPCADNLVTALRIFRPPVSVAVSMQDGKPVSINSTKNKEVQGGILWAAGPWRSSGDWWEQRGWARNEWDIAVQGKTGIALYRLVRDLLEGRWFVEGTYD